MTEPNYKKEEMVVTRVFPYAQKHNPSFCITVCLSLLVSYSIHPSISRYPVSGMFMWVCPTAHMQTCRFNSNMEYPLANRYWGCSLIKKNLLHIFPIIDVVCLSLQIYGRAALLLMVLQY